MNESLYNITTVAADIYGEHRDLSNRLDRARAHYEDTKLKYLTKKWDANSRVLWIPRALRGELKQLRTATEAGRMLFNTLRYEMEVQLADSAEFAAQHRDELIEIATTDARNAGIDISIGSIAVDSRV